MSTSAIVDWCLRLTIAPAIADNRNIRTETKQQPCLNTTPTRNFSPSHLLSNLPPAATVSNTNAHRGKAHWSAIQRPRLRHLPTANHEERNDPSHYAISSQTHNRHCSLTRTDHGTNIIPTMLTHPACLDSHEVLSAEEKASLAAYTKVQADEDSIRLILACEWSRPDFARDGRTEIPDGLHRSRASCELLSGRLVEETGESRVLESSRARSRGAL